jgi:hypothetical protein
MNSLLGLSLPSFSNPTTGSHLLYIPSVLLHFRFISSPLSCLFTTNISIISTVHVHSHSICPPRSLKPHLRPQRPPHFQPPLKISSLLTAPFPKFRIRYHVRVRPPSQFHFSPKACPPSSSIASVYTLSTIFSIAPSRQRPPG